MPFSGQRSAAFHRFPARLVHPGLVALGTIADRCPVCLVAHVALHLPIMRIMGISQPPPILEILRPLYDFRVASVAPQAQFVFIFPLFQGHFVSFAAEFFQVFSLFLGCQLMAVQTGDPGFRMTMGQEIVTVPCFPIRLDGMALGAGLGVFGESGIFPLRLAKNWMGKVWGRWLQAAENSPTCWK